LGLKTFIHDSNALPGRANRLTARFCQRVFLGFDAAKAYFPNRQTTTTGTPARPEILHLPTRAEAAARFGLDPARPVIVVTGGSQGARRLNELRAEAAASLPAETQVLHIAGALDHDRVAEIAHGREGYRVLGFCDQMASAYAVADLVIARAGASSLTEIALAGRPSILVPYPHAADDHQTCNARVFADAGAGVLARESDLTAASLAELAAGILADPEKHARMVAATRTLAVPDAAGRVCAAIESALA
jgi:UDP-N-acetylglucosamine--N-acetylmuramyl-(pentapeptide) pyrophosphoryl-undecaprenol N-acetylglucosamine transferase